jgi:hypothetical protein
MLPTLEAQPMLNAWIKAITNAPMQEKVMLFLLLQHRNLTL